MFHPVYATEVVVGAPLTRSPGRTECRAQYGHIRHAPFGRPQAASESARASSTVGGEGGQSRWRPAVSQIFEGLLVEAVGETGEGGFSYPAIQRFIRRGGLVTHRVGPGAANNGDRDDGLDGLWDDGRGGFGEDENDGGRFEGGSGGGRDVTGRQQRQSDEEDGHDSAWASSSEDDDDGDDAYGETASGSGLVRFHAVPLFVRAPIYYAELLALGRVLYAVHPNGGPRRTPIGAAGRARRQGTGYCLTVVRMCCDVGSGGLDKAEPLGWVGGGWELDEDAGTLQRAQLLVDARLGEKLAPCLGDPDPDVRRDAVSCALSALRGGHSRLRWVSLSVREAERVDPRALLALGFCTTVWVSAFVALLRDHRAAGSGSAKPSRSARGAIEETRRMALQCLSYMAAAGDIATHSWRGVRVLSALQGLLHRGGGAGVGGDAAIAVGVGLRSSRADGDGGGDASTFRVWEEGVLGVIRTLAENGSRETHSMLRSQPGLVASLNDPGLIQHPESLLSPKGLASTATELLKGAGTLSEILCLVRRVRSILATAVRIYDRRVLGADKNDVPDDVAVTLSLVWGWMQRALVQLARDGSDHPSTAARASLAWECLALIRFLLCSATACWLAECRIHPDLTAEVSRAFGGGGETPSSSSSGENHRTAISVRAESDVAAARTGLETLVVLVSVESHGNLDLYRAHPIPPLVVGAADALADSLTHGSQETVAALESYGLGVRLGLAVEASTRLVRESRRLGVEEVHLLRTYPDGRRARVKLLDRILCLRGAHRHGGGGGGRGLHEQVVVSGLLEFVASDMLPDCVTTDIASTRLPASFVRFNGTPLVRNEGIALLERVVARRGGCPAVSREGARQALRHDVPSAECTRLRENRHRSVRAGVSACLRSLARLDSAPVDRTLALVGVPRRAVLGARRDHAARKTRRRWARWVRHKATAVGEAPPMPGGAQEESYRRDGRVDGPLLASPGERNSFFVSGKRHTPTRPLRDLASTIHRSSTTRPQTAGAPTRTEAGPGSEAHRVEERHQTSSLAETFPLGAERMGDTLSRFSSSPVKNDVPTREQGAVLTIEGSLSTLSVPGLLELLAAELATTEESIRVVEVGGSGGGPASVGAASGPTHTSAGAAAPPPVDGSSVLTLSLSAQLAGQLYTRCLAGVLRVPGLLYLEVRTQGTAGKTSIIRSGYRQCAATEHSCIEVDVQQSPSQKINQTAQGDLESLPEVFHHSTSNQPPTGRGQGKTCLERRGNRAGSRSACPPTVGKTNNTRSLVLPNRRFSDTRHSLAPSKQRRDRTALHRR